MPLTHSHLLDESKYLCSFLCYNFFTFIASLVCQRDLFFKLQDCTVKKLYEPDAVAQGLDTQKKLTEEAVPIHSRTTRHSEGYSDLDIGISTLNPCSKGMGLCVTFYTTYHLYVVSTHKAYMLHCVFISGRIFHSLSD
jgi:hypothetical protein